MRWLLITGAVAALMVSAIAWTLWLREPGGRRTDTVLVGEKCVPIDRPLSHEVKLMVRNGNKAMNQVAKVDIVDKYERGTFSKTLVSSDTIWDTILYTTVENVNCDCYSR
jgi:hypothetical protein